MGLFMFAVSASASAQNAGALPINYSLNPATAAARVDASATPLGTNASPAAVDARPAVASTTAVATPTGTVMQVQPAQSVTVQLTPSIAKQAAWLFKGGWPLAALVQKFETSAPLDEETNCLATAIYFEARGESLEGQLAVAKVVMNRAASGRYASDWCGVVKQPAQFSFVRNGQFPYADPNCEAWKKAEAVAELAAANVVPSIGSDVLWYHADYVAPSWRHSLQEVQQIGAHIFYRA